LFFLALLVVFALSLGGDPSAETVRAQDGGEGEIWVGEPVTPGVFEGSLADLPLYTPPAGPAIEVNERIYSQPPLEAEGPGTMDPLVERQRALGEGQAFSPPDLNIAGIGYQSVVPPDTVGDVGPNHYIQMTNQTSGSTVLITDKAGSTLAGPFALDTLWPDSQACQNGRGDPIPLYDEYADRWVLTEFANGANALCVYVSQGPNPVTDGWYTYQFDTAAFPDYPKYAVWPDAYYVSANESPGWVAYALEREEMLAGNPAAFVKGTGTSQPNYFFPTFTPADPDGYVEPPAGSPGLFARHFDDEAGTGTTGDFINIWAFDVDWVTPANSTFSELISVPISEFDYTLCGQFGSFSCVPQPGTSQTLDPIADVIMWRLQYRNWGTHESLVGNFTVDADGNDLHGIRWFELRRSGGSWSVHQEGTLAPDSDHRWMGSIAQDKDGNIGLGYTVSNDSSVHPTIRYTGRKAGDTLGTMTMAEVAVTPIGSGSQGSNRWGDYSAMSIDPADGCTFWHTHEYLPSGGQWETRIVTFDFGTDCTPYEPEYVDSPDAPGPIELEGPPGAPAQETLQITNGGAPLTELDVSLDSISSGYSIASGLPINDLTGFDGPADVVVQCDDPATSPSIGTLSLTTNDPTQPTVSFNLTCTTIAPAFAGSPVPPGPLPMAGLPGQTPQTTFTISNTGTAGSSLDVSQTDITAGYSVISGLPISGLLPGDPPVTVTVQCDDVGSTPPTGTLDLATNDPSQPIVTYDLSCDEVLPLFVGDPDPLFTINIAGYAGTSPSAEIAVTNGGDVGSGLDVNLVSLTGDYSVDGLPIENLGVGEQAAILTVTCNNPGNGTLTLEANQGPGGAFEPVIYNLTCSMGLPSVDPPTVLSVETGCESMTVRYIARGGSTASLGYIFDVYESVTFGLEPKGRLIAPALDVGEVYEVTIPYKRHFPEGTLLVLGIQSTPSVILPPTACTP
jgi:hypothetical protein